ncbi:MAG: hypothetical protein F6K61_13180 [Sphaerospermopsis sp. SIO1G1]|nr:hypothetical protein [Sphaerospermopsis sp. SIO1G1]
MDIEEAGGEIFTTDADGNVTTISILAPGDNSFQTLNVNDNDVVKLEVDLVGSGSISGLDFDKVEVINAPGLYTNIATVTAGGVGDDDAANYKNPPLNPGIDIEKFTNGFDADTLAEAVEIAAGETVTWTYEVTNTGNVSFAASDIVVTDDLEGTITNISFQGDNDNFLAPNETWIYEQTGTAQDLTTTTSSEDIRFHLTGNSYTTGHNGNVRTFTEDGVSVDVSAFSSNKDGSNWRTAYLGAYGGGLGVTNRNESGSHHRVDNGTSNDYVLFEFDQDVTVDRAFLDYIQHDSDISVWIGDRDGDISLLNSDILNDFTKENNNGGSGGHDNARWANFNADELTGDTLVIAANPHGSNDNFKLEKLDISVPGETSTGFYQNLGTVTAGSVSDSDTSSYTNPESQPQNPGIDLEKFVNGIDVTDLNYLPEIAPHADVTFTYTVENTGNVAFNAHEITISDDNGTAGNTHDDFTPTLVASSDVGGDGILSAGETWTYTSETEAAQDLIITTAPTETTFVFSGSSSTTGHRGNTRTFTEDGVSVDVSAFSSNKHFGDWNKAYLGAYGSGLGVTNKYEGGSGHRVDNGGSLDYLVFQFDEDVTVDKALLKYVGHDSDISVWIGDRNSDINHLDNSVLGNLVKENDWTNHGNDRWANINDGNLTGDTLVISAFTGGSNDSFKLHKLNVSIPGEEISGTYQNVATVNAGSVFDSDISGYVNPVA